MKLSLALSCLLLLDEAVAFNVAPVSRANGLSSRRVRSQLAGILDEINSDSYTLGGKSDDVSAVRDDYEILLGELVFSTNDPRVDIVNNFDRATSDDFISWMEKKAENSKDPEERLALKDLLEMIVDVKKKVELSKLAEERVAREAEEEEALRVQTAEAEAEAGLKMSNTDVLRKAVAISSAKLSTKTEEVSVKQSFYDRQLTPEIRMSYEDTLKKLLPPYKAGETPESIVQINYDRFDAQFVKVLNERATNGEEDSAALLEALAIEQGKRIAAATDSLKQVLAMGEPMKMEGVLVKMGREGKIDESFLLLLEANETQARDAGAFGPANLMKRLRMRAIDEKDKQVSSKELRLIRKLLRAEDSQEREKILEDAFTPRENLLVSHCRSMGKIIKQGLPLNLCFAFLGCGNNRERHESIGWRAT